MPSISQEVQHAISAVKKDVTTPNEHVGFEARTAAIDFLEVHVFDRLNYLEEHDAVLPPELQVLRAQAAVLHQQLEAANERFLQKLRRRISSGRYTQKGLTRAFAQFSKTPGSQGGYDALDLFVGGLLGAGDLADARADLEPEMVAYQPTPVRAILALIERAQFRPDDVFYDLGSGLGQVVILVALLTRAHAKGIEFEPTFCEYAERSARRLNVPGVEFIRGDARAASLADGTVFFMFTPFRGALLQRVLERLHEEARKRPIRVCTYGPCTEQVTGASWLTPGDGQGLSEHEVAVFQSTR